jgi:colicin import membrane protein
LAVLAFAGGLMLASFAAFAAQSDTALETGVSALPSADPVARYPSGSIRSVQAADQALAEMEQARSHIETNFAEDERACFSKFFVTSCMDVAKEARRQALAQIRQVEVEANAFKRRARAEERDRALAEKAAVKPAPKVRPIKEPKPSSTVQPETARNSARYSGSGKEPVPAPQGKADPDREARHKAKLEALRAEEAADAQKRAEKVAAYERKVREAEERQREIAARKAEKERKRAGNNSSATPVSN